MGILILGGFFLGFLIIYAIFALDYRSSAKKHQRMTYKEYLRISSVAPDKWRLYDGIYCYALYGERFPYEEIYMKSYFDSLRLGKKCLREMKRKENVDYTVARAKLLISWQEDINRYQEKYTEELKEMYKKNGTTT